MTTPRTLTVPIREAADMLGIAHSTAYASAKEGTFPVPIIRIGSRYVVPKKTLKEILGMSDEEVA